MNETSLQVEYLLLGACVTIMMLCASLNHFRCRKLEWIYIRPRGGKNKPTNDSVVNFYRRILTDKQLHQIEEYSYFNCPLY